MFFWRSVFSLAEIEVRNLDDGWRGWERKRIWERRKEVLRSIMVGAEVVILVVG